MKTDLCSYCREWIWFNYLRGHLLVWPHRDRTRSDPVRPWGLADGS